MEALGGPAKETPGGRMRVRLGSKLRGCPWRLQVAPGGPTKRPQAQGGPRRPQEVPGGPQEAPRR
eukprot:8586912-Pyramimonas_sp.AAC.1